MAGSSSFPSSSSSSVPGLSPDQRCELLASSLPALRALLANESESVDAVYRAIQTLGTANSHPNLNPPYALDHSIISSIPPPSIPPQYTCQHPPQYQLPHSLPSGTVLLAYMAATGNGRGILEARILECEFPALLSTVRAKWGDSRLGETCVKCLEELIVIFNS